MASKNTMQTQQQYLHQQKGVQQQQYQYNNVAQLNQHQRSEYPTSLSKNESVERQQRGSSNENLNLQGNVGPPRYIGTGVQNSGMLLSKTSSAQQKLNQKYGDNYQVVSKSNQMKQDTSPMRVTLDLWDQNQQNPRLQQQQQKQNHQLNNQGSDVKPNQVYNARSTIEGKFNQYYNQNVQSNRSSKLSSFSPTPNPTKQMIHQNQIQQQQFPQNRQFQSPSNGIQNNFTFQNSDQNSQRPQVQSIRQHPIQSNEVILPPQRDIISFKYEQMAQQYSLESLIKQAQQKKLSTQGSVSNGTFDSSQQNQLQHLQAYNFINKIDNFEGDNDHVDEEYESSAEKRVNPQHNKMQRYYEEGSIDSQEDIHDDHHNNYKQQEELDEAEVDGSPQQQDDSHYMHQEDVEDIKHNDYLEQNYHNEDHNPNEDDKNIQKDQSSNLSDEEQFNQLQDQIHGKSSIIGILDQAVSPNIDKAKVKKDESDYGFSSDSKYRLRMTPQGYNAHISDRQLPQQEYNNQESSNNRILTDLSAKVVNINNGFTTLHNPFTSIPQTQQNSNIKQEQIPQQERNSELEQQPQIFSSNALLNKTSDFLQQKQILQYAQKFLQNSDVCNYDSQQNHVVQKLNDQNQQKIDNNNIIAINSTTSFDLLKSDYLSKKQEVLLRYGANDRNYDYSQEQYEKQQKINDQKDKTNQYKEFFINQNNYNQLQVQNQNVNQNSITNSTAQFFNQLKTVDEQNYQQKAQKQLNALPSNQFLTFDDFLNRSSIQQQQPSDNNDQQQNSNILPEYKNIPQTTNQFNNIITSKINLPISQHQSPRKNQLGNIDDYQQKSQIQNNRLITSKSPRPIDIQKIEKDQENKKKREIEMLKQKAKEKELMRIKRIQSAVKIQKCVRGYIERKQFLKQQDNFRYMRKFRRMMSVAYGKYKLRFIQQLVQMMTQANQNKKMMEDDMFRKYVEHCVVFIQKVWKGHYSRNFLQNQMIKKNKNRRALNALIQGWKIRNILANCREVITIKRDLIDLEKQFGMAKGPKDPLNKQIMQQRKKKIDELCKCVPQLYRNGRWVFSLQKKLVQSQINTQKKAQQILSNQHTYSQSQIGAHQNAKSQIFNQTQTLKKAIVNLDNQNIKDQSPIHQTRNKHIFSDQQNQRRQDFNQNTVDIAQQQQVLPSLRSQESVDSSVVLWPSQRQNPFQTTGKIQSDDLYTDRQEAQSDIPITQRTAIADKIQTLDHNQIKSHKQNKPQFRQESTDFDNAQIGTVNGKQQNNIRNYQQQPLKQQQKQQDEYDVNNAGKDNNRIQWVNTANKNNFNKPANFYNEDDEEQEYYEDSKRQSLYQSSQNSARKSPFNQKNQKDDKGRTSSSINDSYTTFSHQKQKLDFYPQQQKQKQMISQYHYDQKMDDGEEDFYEISNGYRYGNQKTKSSKQEDRPLKSNRQQNQQQNRFADEDQNQIDTDKEQKLFEDRPLQQRKQQSQNKQPLNIDDLPIKPAKKNPYEEFMNEEQQQQQFSSQKPLINKQIKNIDENAIKPPKKNPQFNDKDDDLQNETNNLATKHITEKPFFSNKQQFTTMGGSVDDSQIVPPKYNFEELLEKAMQDQGMDPSLIKNDDQLQNKKAINMRRSKTTRPQQHDSDQEQQNSDDNEVRLPTTKKSIKKENLKKRQKYDPRKAIEEANKKKEGGEESKPATSKSAFQEGMQGSTTNTTTTTHNKKIEDRIRSQTTQPKTQYDEEKSQDGGFFQKANTKRKTMKQAEAEKKEKLQQVQDGDQVSQDQQSTTQASSQAGAPKQFLKRKTKAVQFQKVEWKARSRIDCWTNKNEDKQQQVKQQDARSNNISQTRRQTSALRSPRQEVAIKSIKQQQKYDEKKVPINKKMSQQQAQVQQLGQIPNQQVVTKSQNPSITNSFSQVPIQSMNLIQNQMVQNSKSVIKLNNQQMPHHYQDETIDVESIPDENDQYQQFEDQIPLQNIQQQQNKHPQQRSKAQTQNENNKTNLPLSNQLNVQMSNTQLQQNQQVFPKTYQNTPTVHQINQDAYVQFHQSNPSGKSFVNSQSQLNPQNQQQQQQQQQFYESSQNFKNMMNQYNHMQPQFSNYPATTTFTTSQQQQVNLHQQPEQYEIQQQDENNYETGAGAVTLKLEELEKVYEMFHANTMQSFEDCQIQEMVTRDTMITHMTMESMFFNCYSDDIYDTILEELKINYNALCNESNE